MDEWERTRDEVCGFMKREKNVRNYLLEEEREEIKEVKERYTANNEEK